MKKLILTSMALLTLSLNALAAETVVAVITNENDSEIVKLVVETDSNETLMAMRKDIYSASGKLIDEKTFTPSDVFAGQAVMSEVDGRKVVILKASRSSLSLTNGGTVALDYLYNGITGERKTQSYALKKSSGKWALYSGSTQIKKMHFVVNKKAIIGTVGIKEIKLN
jgi:hypothetical protein